MPHQTSSDPKQILWKSKPDLWPSIISSRELLTFPHITKPFSGTFRATLHLVNPMRVPIITTPSSGGLGRLNKQWLECWFKKNSYRPWSSLSLSWSIRSSRAISLIPDSFIDFYFFFDPQLQCKYTHRSTFCFLISSETTMPSIGFTFFISTELMITKDKLNILFGGTCCGNHLACIWNLPLNTSW